MAEHTNSSELGEKTWDINYQPGVRDVLKTFPELMFNLLHQALREKINNIAVLPWESRFEGATDYIDRIKPEDVSEPVMVGIDNFRRSFVTLRIKLTYLKNNLTKHIVQTFFQRYTPTQLPWVPGCSEGLDAFEVNGTLINSANNWGSKYGLELYFKIYNLLSTGKYIDERHQMCFELY